MSNPERVDGKNLDLKDTLIDPLDGLFLSFPDEMTQALEPQLETFNVTLAGIRYLYTWAGALIANAPEVSDELVREENIVLDILYNMHLRLWKRYPLSQNFIMQQLAKLDLYRIDEPKPALTSPLVITNPEVLRVKAILLDGAVHDAKNFVEGLHRDSKDWQTRADPISSNRISVLLGRFAKEIERIPTILREEKQKDNLMLAEEWLKSMYARLRMGLGDGIPLRGEYPNWDRVSKKKVRWSFLWMYPLMENVAQNTIRAYANTTVQGKKELVVRPELIHSLNENETVDIIFEDNGPGLPEDIVQNGFREGLTQWADPTIQGTGIGMAYHAKILRAHYGGDLIPEYRTDEHGNRIPGARLRVRLPVVQK